MGARLVFVHGIGGPRDVDEELRAWTRALAGGMREAGHSELAAQMSCGRFDPVLAYYGDLFQPDQEQGGGLGVESEEAAAHLLELLVDLVDGLTWDLESEQDGLPPGFDVEEARRVLAHARAEAVGAEQEQGLMGGVRRILNVATTLLELKPWRRLGQWVAAKAMVRELAQVVRYLERSGHDAFGASLDRRIRERLAHALGDGPAVVIAHSLGTVVAWETLHDHVHDVPLFTTLGSPISMRTAVWPKLHPRPPRTPECVGRWRNFYDGDDPIAVRPKLEKDIKANTRLVQPKTKPVNSKGLWVHAATVYLAHAEVAGPVAEALVAADREGG
ncbi:hypothetical protein ABT040_40465 [Streptomyces sp. NPDC002688]|uniref:hypothetical protein n=1 Tax=Streptomyces sp. NPDC002688 TaxID=3154423 RepID=UPI0033279773